MNDNSLSPAEAMAVDVIVRNIEDLLSRDNRELALRYATAAVEPLLTSMSDAVRFAFHDRVFRAIKGHGYQPSDFEVVDYEQFELSRRLPLFRGPRPSREALDSGEYFCVMGAAQTFGRLVREPWPNLLSRAIGLPVLNLAQGGLGPDFFSHKDLVPLVQQSRFTIVQVMSGRSVGCDEYPGRRRNTTIGSETIKRTSVLKKLWIDDRRQALKYVRRWNANYLAEYGQLRNRIKCPTMLVWISSRAPSDWKPEDLLNVMDWGKFPQLVGEELYRNVAALFPESHEYIKGKDREKTRNRITGNLCPYFGSGDTGKDLHTEFGYYPSSDSHRELAERLEPWARHAAGTTAGRAIRSHSSGAARKVIFHIGLRQCRSATIQAFFAENELELRQSLSVDYPRFGRFCNAKPDMYNQQHDDLAREIRGLSKFDLSRNTLSESAAYWRESSYRSTIFSSEMFEEAETHQALAMKSMFSGGNGELQVYLVLRDLVHLLPSRYAEKVTDGTYGFDFDTYVDEFKRTERVRYFETAQRWAQAFGWENLHVRLLDRAHLFNGDLIDDVLSTCGVSGPVQKRNLRRPGVQNTSPGWKVIEAIRALANGSHGLPDSHPLSPFQKAGEDIGRRLGTAAIRAGETRGWNTDRGRYLARKQAVWCREAYCDDLRRLNEFLPRKLPEPPDLGSGGFSEREFLPDASLIGRDELKKFYDEVSELLRTQCTETCPAGSHGYNAAGGWQRNDASFVSSDSHDD